MTDGALRIAELGPLREDQWAELIDGESDPFDSDPALTFRPKERHVALVDHDGAMVACAGLTCAAMTVGAEHIEVVGIGGVIVRADRRGGGLARRLMEAALRRAAALGPPFALLFCRSDRAGLYRRAGFEAVSGAVVVDQPGAAADTA